MTKSTHRQLGCLIPLFSVLLLWFEGLPTCLADEPTGKFMVRGTVARRQSIPATNQSETGAKHVHGTADLSAWSFSVDTFINNQEMIVQVLERAATRAESERIKAELALTQDFPYAYERALLKSMKEITRRRLVLREAQQAIRGSRGMDGERRFSKREVDALQRAKFDGEQAENRLIVLKDYSKPRIVRELRGDVATARQAEIAISEALRIARSDLVRLRRTYRMEL